jgi:hypothetical protein
MWQSRVKLLVEAWTGVELETTDMYGKLHNKEALINTCYTDAVVCRGIFSFVYVSDSNSLTNLRPTLSLSLSLSLPTSAGMRRYEDGARLLTHVDREATHAASVIMNIAQAGVRTPWKVEIYDFADRLHEIEMDPGDIVYYESARCLHGRMQALDADYYVNLFAHYRPVGDPEWFTKPNPPGTPAPAIDIGVCSASPDGGSAPVCVLRSGSSTASAPYLSPKMQQLHGPDDLYHFWKQAGADLAARENAAASELKSSSLSDSREEL